MFKFEKSGRGYHNGDIFSKSGLEVHTKTMQRAFAVRTMKMSSGVEAGQRLRGRRGVFINYNPIAFERCSASTSWSNLTYFVLKVAGLVSCCAP